MGVVGRYSTSRSVMQTFEILKKNCTGHPKIAIVLSEGLLEATRLPSHFFTSLSTILLPIHPLQLSVLFRLILSQ